MLAWDAETNTGLKPTTNDYVAGLVKAYPDVFVGFACVDPWKGVRAVAELERAVRELGLIGAHPAWPWQEEMLAVALHKRNVYIDLSGWSPKYFPESLKRDAAGRLKEKCLFGTDYPFIRPKLWLDAFEKLGYRQKAKENILLNNARRILKLPF